MSTRIVETMDAFHAVVAGAVTDVTVYRAPGVTQEYPDRALFVGFNGGDDGVMQTATSSQTWAGLGANKKNERITIPNLIVVERGDANAADLRGEAFAIFADIEAALIADPSLGMSPTVVVAGIAEIAYYLDETSRGVAARVDFTVDAFVRIS